MTFVIVHHRDALILTIQIHIGDVPGDILVFLTGQDEIESLQSLLRTRVAALRPEHQQLMVCAVFSALGNENVVLVLLICIFM